MGSRPLVCDFCHKEFPPGWFVKASSLGWEIWNDGDSSRVYCKECSAEGEQFLKDRQRHIEDANRLRKEAENIKEHAQENVNKAYQQYVDAVNAKEKG